MATDLDNNNNGTPKGSVPGGLLSKLPPVANSPLVQWGFRYANVVILVVCCLVAYGIFALVKMDKNEFPTYTIREGVLVAVYPGATSLEMEQQVLKPLEDYVFSFKEVNKKKTESNATDGTVMIFVELDDDVTDTDAFWNTFNRELASVKAQLPAGVVATEVISDFGDTSALLITMSSRDKTYRELGDMMDDLRDDLRKVESVGRMSVYGRRNEQISIKVDPARLAHYAVSEKTLAAVLLTQGFSTTGGTLRSDTYTSPVYVGRPLNDVADIASMIVLTTPSGDNVRVSDIATVEREYPEPDSYITNNGEKCLVLSIEIKKGKNVVTMGEDVEKHIEAFEQQLPDDVTLFRITNQPYDVNNSVIDFLRELLIAVIAVVIVIMLLLPIRVALIAASTIPISIFISLALFYTFGIELNTVTLACLIVSLGMIVDNSVIIIDDYVELISEGMDRKTAAIRSGSVYFKAIISATAAISVTFFPFLLTMTGMFRDFLTDFPWAITIILATSLIIAELLVPFLQYWFIKPAKAAASINGETSGRKHFSLLNVLQNSYDRLIEVCFNHPWVTISLSILVTILGSILFITRPKKLMPIAERNQFAVEIFLPEGAPLARTNLVADSLERILLRDNRVVSVANFHGCSSPRFQTTYAPQVGGPNFAQFIVNTLSNDATVEVLNEYAPKYSEYFPDAYVRFKQLSYSNEPYPVMVRLKGDNLADVQRTADTVASVLRQNPALCIVNPSSGEPLLAAKVNPDFTTMSRLGIAQGMLELNLALRYSRAGLPVATVWDGTYATPVVLRTPTSDSANVASLRDEQIPVLGPGTSMLRSFASVTPEWNIGQISHRGGEREITVNGEMERGYNAMTATQQIRHDLAHIDLPQGVTLEYGGDWDQFFTIVPEILSALTMAVVIIFFILLAHYRNIRASILFLLCIIFVLPGTGAGLWIQGEVISLTCALGIISLMGILVRNVIIMIDYAQELQVTFGLSVREATLQSAKRRMRPIFLTSAAASMGVLPMVLTGSALWRPMGTVIFWGTIITFFFIVTTIPVLYWKVMANHPVSPADSPEAQFMTHDVAATGAIPTSSKADTNA